MDLPLNDVRSQWFTLFDYLEDDVFDGVFGDDDTESPMVQIRFYVTDSHAREERKTVTTTSTTMSGTTKTVTKTTTVRTTTSSSSTSSSGDAYNVNTLTTDVRNGLNQLKDDLNAEQTDIFAYEDGRVETLGHLEAVHKELEREHLNDQVFGTHLKRVGKEVSSEIGIATSGHNDEQESLKRRVNHTQEIISEKEPIVKKEEKSKSDLENTLSQKQGQQHAPSATALLKDNDALRKKLEESKVNVKKEREEKANIFNQHADIVNKYNELVAKYENSLNETEAKRADLSRDVNKTNAEIFNENADGVNLDHFLISTNKNLTNHELQSKALKSDIADLTKHYEGFLKHLNKLVTSQSEEIARLNSHLGDQQSSITELQTSLSESAKKIVDLHSEVDRENAANLNSKLSTLISTLVDIDKLRRNAQNNLENAQEGWTAKLQLFVDEASRMSRESANQKRANEVQNLLHKLDRLNRERNEIAKQRDLLEAKVATDYNREVINDNVQKELDGMTLKLRWADDEIKKTSSDLKDLLNFLQFKKSFISDQEEQITRLRQEITEIRTLIEERLVTISELENEIRLCDDEIARLRAEIDDLNRRIQELQDAIADKDREIEELKRILALRNARIKELESQLSGSKYVAVKGDMVDELLAKYIQNCPVPVKRLGGGFYLFGLRKIYAKIMNGKLVIRVGGGYMVIEKFIETYADQELQKLMRVAEKEGVSSFMELDLELIALGSKSPVGKSPTGKSPTGKSPKASFNTSMNSSINGTSRTKTVKTTTVTKIMGSTAGGTQVVTTETFVKKD